MARRSGTDSLETAFGSDSFLDVIANTVGVLIILIVLVGIRVRNAPPSKSSDLSTDMATAAPPAEFLESRMRHDAQRARILALNLANREAQRARIEELADQTRRQGEAVRQRAEEQAQWNRYRNERLAETARQEALQRSLDNDARKAESEIGRLEAELADVRMSLEAKRQSRERTQSEARRQWEIAAREAAELADYVARAKDRRTKDETSVKEMTAAIADLRTRIESSQPKSSEAKTLVHHAVSVAKQIEMHEYHFRCKNGRLAFTYLDELLDEVREQANARITPSTMRLDGAVGPIGGFRLRYSLARPPMSMSEQLSQPTFRFALVHWELAAESERIGETVDEVLQPNSAFRVKLRSAPATTNALTLWVYPDSFALAKRVETFLHEQGYTVSLRPLPNGVPIIGSPYGSSSYSQ